VVIPGAGGGLGHLAVQVRRAQKRIIGVRSDMQYALAMNYRVCGSRSKALYTLQFSQSDSRRPAHVPKLWQQDQLTSQAGA
jgi:hypothetical protein